MIGSNDQVWVTSAVTDEDVEKALVWCYSLRRAYTSRLLAVIASPKISLNLRDALNFGFDLVFYLEEDRNTAHLKPKDFAKLYSLLALRYFQTCAYVSPSLLAVKNCDDIFEGKRNDLVLLKDDANADVFLFKPSLDHFKALATGLQHSAHNGSGIGGFFKKWTKNQFKDVEFLDEKFNMALFPGKVLLAFEREISMINLVKYPKRPDSEMLENAGTLEKLVTLHWEKIYKEDVVPLIKHVSQVDGMLLSMDQRYLHLSPKYEKEPIAIVGMSCRFPGSNNLEEFWNLLFEGQDGTCTPPPFRWMREQCSRQIANARQTNAGFLKVPVDEFDAKFFGISPKEVLFLDPQHRLLHELIWEGLEDACIDPHTLRGSPGSIFMGSWTNDYKDILVQSENKEFYRGYMGNSIGAATARLSFLLGLTGPSIATESGCSSVMVAVHSACRSLQNGESNLALVGGVNLLLHQFDKDVLPMVISPDGHCKTFSEDANGFARAEGCGVLVLKKLSDAIRNNDNIWGLIKGSAVAQEGVSSSMGTPTAHCEALAMNDALRDAGVQPEEVSYVETHGTGTTVGDPMEVAAIAKAYHSPSRRDPLIIGSVKTNVGHTESCSGITGIMKVVLAMHHETIPPHRNFTKLNPSIDLDAVPAVIPLECVEWKKTPGKPRIAGVSSFGITGTDAHVIVQESPLNLMRGALIIQSDIERPLQILKISAKTEEALEMLLSRYKELMESSSESLTDIAYSSNVGRANFSHRATIIAKTKDDVANSIDQQKYSKSEVNTDSIGKVCFLFTGQGSQYPGMAKRLYYSSPVFQMHFDYCDKIISEIYNINLKSVLWSETDGSQTPEEISRTIYSQTSIFCVEYALLKLWESWGVKPDYALGHSLGEFAAAVCAGIISVEDAIKLVAERSRLIDELPRGKMLVIQAAYNQVQNEMEKFAGGNAMKLLDYAAINSNEQTVVAGDSDVVMEFSKFCTDNNLKCIVLAATHAFHSKHMDPMLDNYRVVANSVKPMQGQTCEFISGMLGSVVPMEKMNAEYWVQHTRERVNFLNASKKAVELGCNIFVEIGPQPVLSALTMMNNETSLLCLPSLKKKENEWDTILTSLGKLYVKGIEIDWSGLDQFYNRKKVRLPHYPFMGKKFWPELMHVTGDAIHPLLGSVIPNASSTKLFQSALNLKGNEYIKDHAIGPTVVFPGAGYLEICLAAGLATIEGTIDSLGKPSRPMKVENLMIKAPLAVEESKTCQLQTVVDLNTLQENENDWNDMTVKIFHRQESDMTSTWVSHAEAIFSPLPTAEEQSIHFDTSKFLETISQPSVEESMTQLYEKLASIGLKFGASFQSIEQLWKDEGNKSLIAKVKVPDAGDKQDGNQYIIHPVVLDAMIQALMMPRLTNESKPKLWVPIKIGKLLWLSNSSDESNERYIYVGHNSDSEEASKDNISALLLDIKGQVLAIMSEVELIDTTVRAVEAVLEQQTSPMPELWEETWRQTLGPSQNRHDLEICKSEKFYDDDFMNNFNEKYNKMDPESHHRFRTLEPLVYYNFLRCLYECGWVPVLHDELEDATLLKELSINPEFQQMFHYMLSVLSEEEILTKTGPSTWKVTKMPPSLETVQQQLSSPVFTDDMIKVFNSTLLCTKLGENYSKILKGNQSALPILFPEEGTKNSWPSVGDFYTDYGVLFNVLKPMSVVINQIIKQHFKHVKPGEMKTLRILEIGAGTGTFTEVVVQTWTDLGLDVEFDYTDISPAFFTAAEKKFQSNSKTKFKFKRLNIEEDPVSQGFIPNYYDYVFANEVIHATRNINETLRNARVLLRPGGRFCAFEQIKVTRIVTFLFGVLSGYWRFEDFDVRPDHCTMSGQKWRECLYKAGFETVDIFSTLKDRHSLMTSTRRELHEKDEITTFGNLKSSGKTKLWIIFFLDESPISKFLVQQISSVQNRDIVLVRRGMEFKCNGKSFEVNPTSEDDFGNIMKSCEANKDDVTVEGILYCWSLDKQFTDQESVMQPYFFLCKAILKMKQGQSLKLIALLDGTMPVDGNDLCNVHSSTVLGFTKALRNEHIYLTCRCIDIGGQEADATGMEQIFYELWNTDKATQVAYQGATRYIAKLQPFKPTLNALKLPSGTDRFQLVLPETQLISDLQFGPLEPFILEDGEIEVVVKASALNFRDIFSILKPSEEFRNMNVVGFDFAGVVKRIGKEVTMWQVGDHVFGVNVQRNALPSHIKLNQLDVLRVPVDVCFADACTVPAVVTTSYHCLLEVAKITPDDTVLIHAASGGVGLSAIEICKYVGAKIIATAGSKRKQNYLRSLGIEHVFHSRNTKYGDEILKVTNGRGVSVVLNSLTSEGFKEATLKACAKGARFVEMSKLSIWRPEEVETLRPDVKYTIIDVSDMKTEEWRRILDAIYKLYTDKVIKAIPYVRFDAVHIREALQFMQKAKHIGKVVCALPEIRQRNGKQEVYSPMFNECGTYLITGGLGGIGFVVCQWMVENGARHVILAGRNAPNENMQNAISKLNSDYPGANVLSVSLDVGDFEQCRELIEVKIEKMGLPGLRGVMHAAGILQDGIIENHTWPKFSSTFVSKVKGTFNLHLLTKHLNLEHFVLFSSIASLFGSPAQSNHSAANNFEDVVAHYRNSIGLPGISINWGQWSEVGIAKEIDIPGVKPFSNFQALTGLEFALKSHRCQTGVINIESVVLLAKLYPHVSSILDENVWKTRTRGFGTGACYMKPEEFWQKYDSLESSEDKINLLKDVIRSTLKNILRLDDNEVIEENVSFQELGVDSLMFVELKNSIQTMFGDRVTVNANVLKDRNTLKLLSEALLKVIEGEELEEEKIPSVEEVSQLIQEDCQLPVHIKPTPDQKRVDVEDISTVLITGCTGVLGPHVLREISQVSQVTQIICLMRPNNTVSSGEERLANILKERDLLEQVNMSKVRCVTGNVTLPNLGLEPIVWEEMANSVDAIFHCAACVSHTEHYIKRKSDKDTRAVNIGGTNNILELACTGAKLKQVYCASSVLSVTKVDEDGSFSESWPETNDYDGLTTVSYPITKFVVDVLLKQAVLERGIPGKVFRLPYLMGDSRTGRFVLENNHAMLRYMFILKQAVMPSTPVPFLCLPVDICAWASVKIFFNPTASDDIYNISNTCPALDQEFIVVAKKLGYHVDIVELSEFTEKIDQSTDKFSIFKELYNRKEEDVLSVYNTTPSLRQWIVDGGSDKKFTVSRKITTILPEFYLRRSSVMESVYRDLLFAKNHGWFEKFDL